MPTRPPLRLALIGWGAIAQTAADMLANSNVEIVAVAVRDVSTDRPPLPATARLISSPNELESSQPDVVAEAASRESVAPWGLAALGAGADFIVSSVSALADKELLASLREAAVTSGAQIHVQPGALGGVDALAAARLMGIDHVEHRIVKPPTAWRNTPAETLCDLDGIVEASEFYSASASETATAFPKNANVAMTTALAGIGPERTKITLVADPTTSTNQHHIAATGAFGRLEVTIANNPLPANPKTSAMAALNLVRAIDNRVSPMIV